MLEEDFNKKTYSWYLIKGVNSRAVYIAKYSEHFVNWKSKELRNLYMLNRKLICLNFNTSNNYIDRISSKKRINKRKGISIENCIESINKWEYQERILISVFKKISSKHKIDKTKNIKCYY